MEGEINKGEAEGRREPPKRVLPLVRMYVKLHRLAEVGQGRLC